jgi:hypothetical protein
MGLFQGRELAGWAVHAYGKPKRGGGQHTDRRRPGVTNEDCYRVGHTMPVCA